MRKETKNKYRTVSVESAENGWIIKEPGKPAEVFFRWESVVYRLELLLTSKGEE